MVDYEYNPGSDEALDEGCTCPVVDNGHGTGSYKGGWIRNADCPLHGFNIEE